MDLSRRLCGLGAGDQEVLVGNAKGFGMLEWTFSTMLEKISGVSWAGCQISVLFYCLSEHCSTFILFV